MSFTNLQLDTENLPNVESIEYIQVEARYPYTVAALTASISCLIAVGAYIVLRYGVDSPPILPSWIWPAVAVLILIITGGAFAHAKSFHYAVREHDIALRKGVFWQSETIQPLVRLQHVELQRGPLEKWLGMAKLKLFSAGSGQETFAIPGLSVITAARTRRYVLTSQAHTDKSQPLNPIHE